MAQIQIPFLFLLALLSSIYRHTSLVYAIRHQKQNSETSTVFSLPLYHYDSIINDPRSQNYTYRAISRLAGDAARVKYINSRLRKALFNYDPSNFQQEEENIQPPDSPLTYKVAEYVVRVGVGNPIKEFYLLADTGSDITWLKCLPCTECSPPSDSIFDPSNSSSYQPLPCDSQQCNSFANSNCNRDQWTCLYDQPYADGTSSKGDFATETLSFGSSGSIKDVAIGCGREITGFEAYAGILGLGKSEIAFPSQIKASSFSYCLVDPDSQSSSPSTLEFNSAPPGDSIVVPFRTNPLTNIISYYYVELTGITVGADPIPIPPSVFQIGHLGSGGIIVDSGTRVTKLNPQIYSSLRDAFKKNTQNLQASQATDGFDTCYDVPTSAASSVSVPPMSFQFPGGETLPLPRENYFTPVDVSADGQLTKFCLAFQPTDGDVSIIGSIQQQGMRVTYDLANNLIGFSSNKC